MLLTIFYLFPSSIAVFPCPAAAHGYCLNTDAIDARSYMKWSPERPFDMTQAQADVHPNYRVEVVPSAYFDRSAKRPAKELEQKMLIGTFLNYSSPKAPSGPASSTNANGKRPSDYNSAGFNKMMQLGDNFPGTNSCFAIFCPQKITLVNFASGSSLATSIKLGDVLGFYEPRSTDKRLGSDRAGQIVIEEFTAMVFLGTNVYLQRIPMQMADEGHGMVHFREYNVNLTFALGMFLTGAAVPCSATTCDRQLSSCKGCLGASFKRSVVFKVMTEVGEQYLYDAETGVATFPFRSWAFTKLIAPGVITWANNGDIEMRGREQTVRRALDQMGALVNRGNGWTMIGWHRRGMVEADTTDAHMNMNTVGHLVALFPTGLSPQDQATFDNLAITV